MTETLPVILSGKWGKCHCQGIAVDKKNRYIYYSFTTKLVKCDFNGKLIGWADGITGHLGCLDFNDDDGKIYASLEYKNDDIGKGILSNLGVKSPAAGDGFYAAVFDAEKIVRPGMDALHDGIMRAAFLKTATDDYYGCGYGGSKHVFGCSGIDGMAIGPDFGSSDNKKYLHAAYGIYSDLNRTDNDYQVILQYSIDEINKYALPLSPGNMHRSGPDRPREKYFIYTGNTYYGIQNLEYDSFTGDYFACVYHGFKPDFPNYTLFVIDGKTAPVMRQLAGNDCSGKTLTLKNIGGGEKGIYGITRYLGDSEFGTLGLYSFGNGNFYAAEPDWNNPDNLSVTVRPFRLKTDASEWNFEEIK